MAEPITEADLRERISAFLADHDPAGDRLAFLRARFDAGLAWVHFPVGLGGLAAGRALQPVADDAFAAAGAPDNRPSRIGIGLGMAAPTILVHGTDAQRTRFLRPLWTGEEVWCQLFSEPGAGSDLAGLATRARRDGDGWLLDGQKVWTSMAHVARWAILLARTDPDVPKHAGLTFFVLDMTAPGVEVRPLRQLTGEAEFNEVYLTGVRVPDEHRLGDVGAGWKVAQTTLMNERVSIGGGALPREGGMIGVLARAWREQPAVRTPGMHDTVMRLWVRAEAARLTGLRVRQQLAAGAPGPDGSAVKLSFATLNQQISAAELDLRGDEGLRRDSWAMSRPDDVDFTGRDTGYRYLRAKGNSIEGGTSEVLRNIIAERVLGLPAEPRVDTRVAWKDLPPMSDLLDLLESPDEQDLRSGVRDMLAAECPWQTVLSFVSEGAEAYDAKLWRTVATGMGLAGLLVPESQGGAGAQWRAAAIVVEELGRAVAPVPFVSSAVVATTALGSSDEPSLLGRLASGELTAALAVPYGLWSAPTLLSVVDGAVTGTVRGVADALGAGLLLVPADDGLYAVDGAAVRRTRVLSLDETRPLADLEFRAAPARLVGSLSAVPCALRAAATMTAAEQIGLASWCLDETVGYLKERYQFGRPVGSFQALKHRLADLWVELTQARAVVAYAAADLAAGAADGRVAASLAKIVGSEVAVRAAEECVQMHGGIGFTWEHPAHLYLKRAKATAVAYGSPDRHRARLATLVDLPLEES